jgi:hypothetical protein
MSRFDTIMGVAAVITASTVRGILSAVTKRTPTRRQPHRGVSKAIGYLNNEEIQLRISSNVSSTEHRTDSLKRFFTRQHLLPLKVAHSLQKLRASFVLANVPPRKEVPPVYMEVA